MNDENRRSDSVAFTIADVNRATQNLPPEKYDAFLLYADEDFDSAKEMTERLEKSGLKLCLKERDFVGGSVFVHNTIQSLLVENRCERLIVILTTAFDRSPLNEYICNMAESLGIDQRERKIIPCLYEQYAVSGTFQNMHSLRYYKETEEFYDFWELLKASVKPKSEIQEIQPPTESSQEIVSKHDYEIVENSDYESGIELVSIPLSSLQSDDQTIERRKKIIKWLRKNLLRPCVNSEVPDGELNLSRA